MAASSNRSSLTMTDQLGSGKENITREQIDHANEFIEPGAAINDGLTTDASMPVADEKQAQNGDLEPVKPFVHPMHPSQFPDGGTEAWLCVAGAAASMFCSFGWINTVGIFQQYYVSGPLREYTPSTVGWIVSTEVFFMLFLSPWTGLFYDNFGPKWLLLVGSTLHVFGLMMTSISTHFYSIFLSQGVCSAIGASMIFGPSMSAAVTWFFRRRGLALGLVAAGSSLGGVVFPIVVSHLIPRVGFGWAMRTCAFIILALMIFANLTIRSRVPPIKRKFEAMAFVRPLRQPAFALLILATFLFYYGLFQPVAFIVSDAVAAGMSLSLSQYLVAILNATSIFGRTLPGYVGDKIGRFNTMIFMCGMTAVLILALWIPANNNIGNIFFSGLFGFSSGAAIGLTPALIAQISEIKDIGTRTGTVFGIASIAALTGTPIGGAIIVHDHGKFLGLKIFAGVLTLIGCGIFSATRVKLAGWSIKAKV